MAIIRKEPMRKLKAIEVEIAIARYFNPRANLIIPNVSWGMFNHECDLISLSKNGYLTEIEIKVTKADLKADLKKRHNHYDDKIMYLFFAIPYYLQEYIEYIPKRAGILRVGTKTTNDYRYLPVFKIKEASPSVEYKVSEFEKLNLYRLGAMRIWNLKKKLLECKNN